MDEIAGVLTRILDMGGTAALAGVLSIIVIGLGVKLIIHLSQVWTEHQNAERSARVVEREQFVGEIQQAREQTHVMITNHMAHLQESQEKFMAFQAKAIEALNDISTLCKDGFGNTKHEHERIHDRLDKLGG